MCAKSCLTEGDRKVALSFASAYQKYGPFEIDQDSTHLVKFNKWVEILIKSERIIQNTYAGQNTGQAFSFVSVHFAPQSRLCPPCGFPVRFFIRQETFSEDFEFMLKESKIWQKMSEKAKAVSGTRLGYPDDFLQLLRTKLVLKSENIVKIRKKISSKN